MTLEERYEHALSCANSEELMLLIPQGKILARWADVKKVSDSDMRRQILRILLVTYASMSNCELAHSLARAFLHGSPGGALVDATHLACQAQKEASELRISDTSKSDAWARLSGRLQLAVAGCLQQLATVCPDSDVQENAAGRMLSTPDGQEVLNLCQEFSCKLVIAQPIVQQHLTREWRGELLHEIVRSVDVGIKVQYGLIYVVILFFNIVFFMPLVAVCPPCKRHLVHFLSICMSDNGEFVYLLSTPVVKFVLAEGSDLALTVCLTALRLDAPCGGADTHAWGCDRFVRHFFTVWIAAGLFSELTQFFDDGLNSLLHEVRALLTSELKSRYFTDIFNFLDLPAYTLALLAVLLPTESFERNSCLSVAVLCMWMRQLRLLFFFSMDSQVLLQAVVKMMKDVANWFMLVVFLLLAFTSALYVLFRDQGTWTDTKNTAGAGYPMDECDQTNVPFSKWEVGFQLLVEGAFASQVAFDCVWKTDRREQAVTLLHIFQLMIALLLVNTLIAMMTKTFDNIWEAQEVQYMNHRAGMITTWREMPDAPVPFNVLSAPYVVCKHVVEFLLRFSPAKRASSHKLERQKAWSAGPSPSQMSQSSDRDRRLGFVLPIEFMNMPEEEMRNFIGDFLNHHEDEMAAENRWRTKMMAKFGTKFAQLQTEVKSRISRAEQDLFERLDAQDAVLRRQEEMIESLLRKQGLNLPAALPTKHAPTIDSEEVEHNSLARAMANELGGARKAHRAQVPHDGAEQSGEQEDANGAEFSFQVGGAAQIPDSAAQALAQAFASSGGACRPSVSPVPEDGDEAKKLQVEEVQE